MKLLHSLILTPMLAGSADAKPVDEAKALFKAFIPKIEASNPEETIQMGNAIAGDLNGDGKQDVIISFVGTPKEGGNAVLSSGHAVYLQKNAKMRVAGELKLDCGARIDRITKGKIVVTYTDCSPPYLEEKFTQEFAWKDGKATPTSEKHKIKR